MKKIFALTLTLLVSTSISSSCNSKDITKHENNSVSYERNSRNPSDMAEVLNEDLNQPIVPIAWNVPAPKINGGNITAKTAKPMVTNVKPAAAAKVADVKVENLPTLPAVENEQLPVVTFTDKDISHTENNVAETSKAEDPADETEKVLETVRKEEPKELPVVDFEDQPEKEEVVEKIETTEKGDEVSVSDPVITVQKTEEKKEGQKEVTETKPVNDLEVTKKEVAEKTGEKKEKAKEEAKEEIAVEKTKPIEKKKEIKAAAKARPLPASLQFRKIAEAAHAETDEKTEEKAEVTEVKTTEEPKAKESKIADISDELSTQPVEGLTVTSKNTDINANVDTKNFAKQDVKKAEVIEVEKAELTPVKTEIIAEEPKQEVNAETVAKPSTGLSRPLSMSSVFMAKNSEIEEKDAITENKFPEPVGDELPPVDSAKPGECYGKIIIPGEYKEVEENIEIAAASTRTENVPAVYKTVEEEIVISPERTEEIKIPAIYKTVKENVEIAPARKEWQKLDGSETVKLVELPATYKSVEKQVLVQEERTEKKTIPAVTKKVNKQVVVSEADTKEIKIPAKYKKVIKRMQVSADKLEWTPVVCDDALDHETVRKLQGALIAKGFPIQNVDGILGKETQKAIKQYQHSIGIKSSSISKKTLENLGINS